MFWFLALLVILLDQISKHIIDTYVELGATIRVVPGVFDLCYVQNTGAAFSIFEGRQIFLILLTSALIILVTAYVIINGKHLITLEKAALGLIVGGGIGNLISRITLGYVIDFLNIYFIPVFNVADIGITVGAFLLLLSILVVEPAKLRRAEAAAREKEAAGLANGDSNEP